jgi:hypothetical protein
MKGMRYFSFCRNIATWAPSATLKMAAAYKYSPPPQLNIFKICLRSIILLFSQLLQQITVRNLRLLEDQSLVQSPGSFPAIYGTRSFVTAFTRALHLSLYWGTTIQSTPSRQDPSQCILWLYSDKAGILVSSISLRTSTRLLRFEVFTAMNMKNCVFWDVTPCGSCKNRRLGGT